jgi:PST family polysaccharide transporter
MKAYRTISLFTFPAMAGISALAMPLTIFAFGETFAPAAVPIAALAIHGALQSLVTIQGTVFMTLGRTDLMFRWAMISLGCIIGCLLIGVQWGLNGAALGYLLASLICSPLSMRAMMKLIGAQWGDLADAILVHSLLSILMGLLVFALTLILPDSWSALAVLAVCIPVGVLIYIGGLLAFDRKAIDDVLGTARSVLMKRAS